MHAVATLFLLAALAATALATTPEELGKPTSWVTDAANALPAADEARIEAYAQAVETALHVQFAVVVVPTVAPMSIEEFTVKLFERWGVGGAKSDEGLMLCVAVQDRTVRFETGYGLEGALPDGRLGGIVRADIVPRFQAGDMAGGILGGLQAAAAFVAESKGLPAPSAGVRALPRRARPRSQSPPLALIVLGLVVFSLVASANRRGGGGGRRGGPPWYGGGPWIGGGGFGGGGGGFGGGGFGGGFGGFGGGGSGGGGATGHW